MLDWIKAKMMGLRMQWMLLALVALELANCAGPQRNANPVKSVVLLGCPCAISDVLVADRVFFDLNQASLTPDAWRALRLQAHWLANHPQVNVLIAGNADERGTESYNLALGKRRAHVARDGLEELAVAAGRIQTVSYGKDCPVAPGDDPAALQQNRNAITSMQGSNPQNCH